MTKSMTTGVAACVVLMALAGAGVCEGKLPVGGRAERQWGRDKAGLAISLGAAGPTIAGGPIEFGTALRNSGAASVKLPAMGETFGWLMIQRGKEQYFTARMPLAKTWPGEIGPGKTIDLGRMQAAGVAVYQYRRGLKFFATYKAGRKLDIPSAGTVGKILQPGKAFVRLVAYLPCPGRAMLLKSNVVELTISPPDFAKLDTAKREAFTADLLRRFDRDAWSASAASRDAIAIGKPLVPALIKAAMQTNRPSHSRLWLATTVASIPDKRCADALTELLNDGLVRQVVAYYGPQQNSKKLDQAIVAKALELRETRFIGYALLGYLRIGQAAPEQLLSLGIDSTDPRTRAAASEVLGKLASDEAVAALTRSLADKDPTVRATAARVLGDMGNASPRVIAALIAALKSRDRLVTSRVLDALGKLAGPAGPKTQGLSPAKAAEAWGKWWQTRQKQAKPRN